MAEFSNVLNLINAVSYFNDAYVFMTEKALTEYFRNLYKDEKTYEEFYKQGCREMSGKLFEYIALHIGATDISKDAEDYLYGVITSISNPYISFSDNCHSVIKEMLHDACGYVGANLNDDDFEDFHEYMDNYVSVVRYIKIMVGKKLGRPFEENNDIINEYAIKKGISPNIFYPKKETIEVYVNRRATDLCTINIERNGELTYAILKTSNYNGGMGATIVKCHTPIALEHYGFDNAECYGISMLKVGELYTSTKYGIVVVRMS